MSIKIFVDIHDSRWDKYKIDFNKIVRAVYNMIAPPRRGGHIEVSIILTNDSEIRALNKKYRGIDKPTNVLSFETGDAELLGDIYISFDTCLREAQAETGNKRQEIGYFINHATHLVIHGVLHLLGYDHLNDSDAEKMEALEVKILAKFGIKNPYDNSPQANYQLADSSQQLASREFMNGTLPIKNADVANCLSLSANCYLLVAILGGITAFGFAPFNLWWATLLGIGGMYYLIVSQSNKLAVSDKQLATSAFLICKVPFINSLLANCSLLTANCYLLVAIFGGAYAVASFWWVLNSIYVVPELAEQFAVWTIPGIIGIAIVGALIFSIPFLVIRSKPGWNASTSIRPIVFAATWAAVLWLREWLFTGFPWNPIANITMPFPVLANSMSLWGALGLTFVIIGLVASSVECVMSRNKRYTPFFIFILLLIVGIIYGHNNINQSSVVSHQSSVVRIVQPAFSQEQKASHNREQAIENANENIRKLVELAKAPPAADAEPPPFGGAHPELIIFPETSYPFVIRQDGDKLEMAKELGVPVIIGATSWDDGKFYNSMIIANAGGEIEKIYSKSHLVPFGEYRPFGDIIPTPGQLARGNGAEVIETRDKKQEISINFVPAICYEIIFSDSLVPDCSNSVPACAGMTNNRMPNAVINITNDTWFGTTPGTYQHLDMTRRQAIETGLPVVRANYSGISAFISADGRVISSLPVGKSGVLDGKIWGAHKTPYRKIGLNGTMIIILLFSIVCILALRKNNQGVRDVCAD
jgi:apolipoprotein N-acyltransferase